MGLSTGEGTRPMARTAYPLTDRGQALLRRRDVLLGALATLVAAAVVRTGPAGAAPAERSYAHLVGVL